MMKLFEVPRKSWIRLVDTGEQFFFDHLDGMYSLCLNHAGDVVHLVAWAEVEMMDAPAGNPTLPENPT